MTLDEYQKLAAEQEDQYFPRERPIEFYGLCLAGEAGEAVDELKKLIYYPGHKDLEHPYRKLELELGDVLWSLARLASKVGLTLEEIAKLHAIKLQMNNRK